ncbi:MAG: hypothetical protein IPP71_09870 [Bacteroidetes bacterium]|nr:hypothetical protein [Bacteroidota bacterium]
MTPRILIFEITLKGVTPPVWRIVEINRNSTLHELHAAIQVAMGWKNAHLYSFNKGDGKTKCNSCFLNMMKAKSSLQEIIHESLN